jgi:hypothetical protein
VHPLRHYDPLAEANVSAIRIRLFIAFLVVLISLLVAFKSTKARRSANRPIRIDCGRCAKLRRVA